MLRREADNGASYSPRNARESMNRALDESLDPAERDTFHAHLDRAPQDAQLWQQMRRVDRMIHSAQTVKAPAGFSARVMAAIAASRTANCSGESTREFRTSLSIVIALMIAACTAVPLLGGTLLLLLRMLSSGAFVQLTGQLRDQWLAMQVTLTSLSNTLATAPMARIIALASLPAAATCGWLARLISIRTPDVTYRIPVSFVASSSI
jgi:ferric-dicitrate binding protein FerR (iron transport regulator)